MERNGISLRVFGELDALPLPARTALRHAMNRTAKCSDMIVNLALNYSGREEILRAARLLMQQGVKPEAVTEEAFRSCLYSAGQPDPDLIIRTSGEQRISNYLTFQSAYSELYFTSTYWPDFTPEALHKAGQFLYTDAARSDAVHQGLGLYFAKKVAQFHGGTLVLSNLSGTHGACAELRLPIGR